MIDKVDTIKVARQFLKTKRSNTKYNDLISQANKVGQISYEESKQRTLEYVAKEFDNQRKFFENASGIVIDFKLRVLDSKGEIHRVHPRHYKEYKEWRLAVFTRDNFTCKHCGSKKNLQAHHIKQYALFADDRLNIDNGLTLCKTCHNKIPRQRRPR